MNTNKYNSLRILRQNILSQLEQAELNLALRESMETYKPNITPASEVDFPI